MTLQRTFRYIYLRFLRVRRDPAEISRGLAIGVFIGLSPLMGIHMVLAVALAMLFKGNKFMALIGSWVGNPLTFSFIFYLEYKVGRFILGESLGGPQLESMHPLEILHASWNILLPISIGSLLVGLMGALPAYFLSNPMIRWLQARRMERVKGKG